MPAADVQCRRGDVRVMVFDPPAFPVVIAAGVLDPVVKVTGQRLLQVRQVNDGLVLEGAIQLVERRQQALPRSVGHVVAAADRAQVRHSELPHGPRQGKSPGQRAALVGPALVVVRRGDARRDAGQGRRVGDGAQPLRRAHVGPAEHPHLARAPRLLGAPGHRVVAVVGLVQERVELALGGIAAPRVLDHHRVAVRHGPQHVQAAAHALELVVGRALQQHGKRFVPFGTVHVGIQGDAVSHPDRHAEFAGDLGIGAHQLSWHNVTSILATLYTAQPDASRVPSLLKLSLRAQRGNPVALLKLSLRAQRGNPVALLKLSLRAQRGNPVALLKLSLRAQRGNPVADWDLMLDDALARLSATQFAARKRQNQDFQDLRIFRIGRFPSWDDPNPENHKIP